MVHGAQSLSSLIYSASTRNLLLSHFLAASGWTWSRILWLVLICLSHYWTKQVYESPHRSLICCISCLSVCLLALLAEYHVNSSCLDFSKVKKKKKERNFKKTAIPLEMIPWQGEVNCECDHREWKGKLHHPCNTPALWIMINHSLILSQSPINV